MALLMKRVALFVIVAIISFNAKSYSQEWVQLGIGRNSLNANDEINALCLDNSGFLYAAGAFTDSSSSFGGSNYVSQWNGSSWKPVGTDSFALRANGPIWSVAAKDGDLFAAGSFTNNAGKHYVARWDGMMWRELGSGSNALNADGTIFTLALDDSGNVYAAGDFRNSAGYYYVAKWNGTSWNEVGSLHGNAAIKSIYVKGMDIYLGGSFFNASLHTYVAKWNGSYWNEIGPSSNPFQAADLWSLYVDSVDNVYVGGFFTNTSGNYFLANWNGVSWAETSSSTGIITTNGPILSIAAANHQIFLAGIFTDTNSSNYVLKWSEGDAKKVGTISDIFNCTIYKLLAAPNGDLYAAGNFTDSISCIGRRFVAKHLKPSIIMNETATSEIKIFPNPAFDNIELVVPKEFVNAHYTLYSTEGKVLLSGIIRSEQENISTNSIKSGTYLLKINSCNSIIKLIKE